MLEHIGDHHTCLEKQMYGYLTELGLVKGVDYYEQYSTGNYVLDFAFVISRNPFKGIDIEVDGDAWHNTPDQRRRDGFRTYKLHKHGWIVIRFKEEFTIDDVKLILSGNNIDHE